MTRVSMACLSACWVGSVGAQNYSPIVDDRVATDGVDYPVISNSKDHRGGLDLSAVISTAYDSNIFLSRKDPTPDTVIRISPAVSYTQGDAREGEGGFIRFAYQPTGVIYAENSSESRVDHEAALTAGWRGKAWSLTYVGAARKLADATADTGRPTDRIEFANEVVAAWIPREKVTVELAAGNTKSDYADPTLYDSREAYGRLGVRYTYSPKTEVGMAYQVGRLLVEGGSNQTLQQVTGSIAWQPREKIKIALQAGAEHRDAEDGSDVNPVLESRVEWSPRSGTSLFLAGYQRQEASAYYAGQDYNVLGATAGISQRLGGNWTARVEGGREKVSYSRVSGSGASGRKDAIWFIRPSIQYNLTEALDVSVFYRASNDTSTAKDFGYSQRLAGIELTYKF